MCASAAGRVWRDTRDGSSMSAIFQKEDTLHLRELSWQEYSTRASVAGCAQRHGIIHALMGDDKPEPGSCIYQMRPSRLRTSFALQCGHCVELHVLPITSLTEEEAATLQQTRSRFPTATLPLLRLIRATDQSIAQSRPNLSYTLRRTAFTEEAACCICDGFLGLLEGAAGGVFDARVAGECVWAQGLALLD